MEITKALPSHLYGDPAKVVENAEMRALGCRACTSGFILSGRVACTDERNPTQKGVPYAGDRCKWFVDRG